MAKDFHISLLLDYYGPMLTEKQRELLGCYYNDDLSLAEIAQNESITRQGVRDSIKRAEASLTAMEEKLHFAARVRRLENALESIRAATDSTEIIEIIDNALLQEDLNSGI
jgi:predicted DNA-binding protein YlxM (UPF0122 family)